MNDRPDVVTNTVFRLGLLPDLRTGRGTAQIIWPEWVYDFCVYFFWIFNWCIAAVASRFPIGYTARDWATDPALAPNFLPAPEPGLKESIRARGEERHDDAQVWALWDSLPAPKANDMLGNWRGKVVRTGSWLDIAGVLEIPAKLIQLEWGKRFFNVYKGDPLIWIIHGQLIVPVPFWGNVSLPEINLRGKTGAAMTYDHQPWKDHFRLLDDGRQSGRRMMLGNWMSREKNGGWFTLEELPETNEAIADLVKRSPY